MTSTSDVDAAVTRRPGRLARLGAWAAGNQYVGVLVVLLLLVIVFAIREPRFLTVANIRVMLTGVWFQTRSRRWFQLASSSARAPRWRSERCSAFLCAPGLSRRWRWTSRSRAPTASCGVARIGRPARGSSW